MNTVLDDLRINEQAFEQLLPQLEETHFGHWVVITNGQLLVVAPTREEALRTANGQSTEAVSRLIRKVGEELPKRVTVLQARRVYPARSSPQARRGRLPAVVG